MADVGFRVEGLGSLGSVFRVFYCLHKVFLRSGLVYITLLYEGSARSVRGF